MATPQHDSDKFSHQLTTALVLRVEERTCEIVDDSGVRLVRFASAFPSPRRERVSPGHLVAVAAGPQGGEAVVWRWYDAVVLGPEGEDSVRLWEPAHGEVVAQARTSYKQQPPGSRAYTSAGLPGAEWWVADSTDHGLTADVELDDVDSLYTEYGMWSSVFDDNH